MAIKRSDITKIISSIFILEFKSYGFQQVKRTHSCFRIRKDFVDVLSIQIGRTGTFYLHYFINLLADPIVNTLDSYRVGERINKHPQTEIPWNYETIEEVKIHIESITDVTKCNVLPYFESISSYKDYAIEIISDVNYKKRSVDLDLAISLASLNKFNKVFWLCDDDINTLLSTEDYESIDEYEKNIQLLKHLRYAAKCNSKEEINHLLDTWKQDKLLFLRSINE